MSARLSAGLVCASALILAVGCYSYYPYSPGYYGGYPAYTSPPVTTAPGGAYLPGTVIPSPGIESGSQFQAPTRAEPTYPDAPLYDDNPEAGSGTGGNYVPNYRDVDDRSGSGSGDSFGPSGQTPFGLKDSGPADGVALAAAEADEAVPVRTAEGEAIAEPASLDPYAHDPNYRWLRGVVAYERDTRTWSVVYDPEPSASDRWGGRLALADDPLLQRLKDGDVVLIEGRVDASTRDPSGRKPRYRIEHLVAPLVPDPSRSVARSADR